MGAWCRRLATALVLAGVSFVGASPAAGAAAPGAADYAAPGPHAVEVTLAEWQDAKRGRAVPVKVYAPKGISGPLPLVLFSHGLGGTREGGAMWGEHWASHGFVSVHLQHRGSDDGVWKPAQGNEAAIASAMGAAKSAGNLVARAGDVGFAIDEIARRKTAGEPPFDAVDLARVGLAGHSFGAHTTLAAAGQRFPDARGVEPMLKEPRLKAAIAMSPNARNQQHLAEQFGEMRLPMLFLTGTADNSVLGDGTKWQDRTLPFRYAPGPDKVLVVLDGADHMIFNGHALRRKETRRDAVIQRDVKALTLAFWEATLEGNATARAWLIEGGAKYMLLASDQFQAK